MDRMHVTAPYIQPSVDTGSVGRSQWTAFVSILDRWTRDTHCLSEAASLKCRARG
jgi:hypothetical protein